MVKIFCSRPWPAGLPGTAQAGRAVEALQLEPMNVVARSQDIALAGRVLDYTPEYLRRAQWVTYQQREFLIIVVVCIYIRCLNCLTGVQQWNACTTIRVGVNTLVKTRL